MSPSDTTDKKNDNNNNSVNKQQHSTTTEDKQSSLLQLLVQNPQFTSNFLINPSFNPQSTDPTHPSITKMVHKHKPVVFVIGGPGSGKGTICDRIRQKYGFTHLSTGDLLREEVASGSDKGKRLNEIMKSGKLVSNDEVLDLLQSAIEKLSATSSGFLIDGYPREVGQAIEFEKKVCSASVVMYFNCSDEEMIKRLLNRGLTSGRADDNEETIKKRLETFHTHTQPILDHFGSEGKLETVNTLRAVEDVYGDVERIVLKIEAVHKRVEP